MSYNKLPQYDQRRIAMSAARSQLERSGITRFEIERTVSADDALAALDDLFRLDRDTWAARWYEKASKNQIALFKSEWRKYQRTFLDMDCGYSALENGDLDTALKIAKRIVRNILK